VDARSDDASSGEYIDWEASGDGAGYLRETEDGMVNSVRFQGIA
jgi:hypothetical protein